LQLIKHKSYEEMQPVLQAQQSASGEFVVLDFGTDDSGEVRSEGSAWHVGVESRGEAQGNAP
jgi:hypothetical protein